MINDEDILNFNGDKAAANTREVLAKPDPRPSLRLVLPN